MEKWHIISFLYLDRNLTSIHLKKLSFKDIFKKLKKKIKLQNETAHTIFLNVNTNYKYLQMYLKIHMIIYNAVNMKPWLGFKSISFNVFLKVHKLKFDYFFWINDYSLSNVLINFGDEIMMKVRLFFYQLSNKDLWEI